MTKNLWSLNLAVLFGLATYVSSALGATVVWTIDSSVSYIRLNIPDQLIPTNSEDPPVPAGVRDYSGPFFSAPAASWTDAGGRRSFVQGTITSDYVEGTSIQFNSGAHSATAIPFGAFRPDGATWNGTTFNENSTAPAAFAASVILDPANPTAFVAGFASIRDVSYDLLGFVRLSSSGSGWIGTDNFQAGVVPGAKAHLATVLGHFNEVLSNTVNAENSGSLTIQNLGGGLRRLTLPINVPVSISLNPQVTLNASATGSIVATATVVQPAEVVARFVYHSGFSGAGTPPNNRIDTAKVIAKEGSGPATLSYSNLINTSHGINGLLFDIQNLGNPGALSAADFEVQVSPTGAFDANANPPSGWPLLGVSPSVSVTAGSPSRVLLQWPNGTIMNRWVRVKLKANANTGLLAPQTYYLGHLLGESGPTANPYTVAFADITPIRSDVGTTVNANSLTDIDKSGTVAFADISAMRPNVGAQLSNITIP